MVRIISDALSRLLALLALTGALVAPDPASVQTAQFPAYAALMPAESVWLSENYCGSNALVLIEPHLQADEHLSSAYVHTEIFLPDVHNLKTWYADDPEHEEPAAVDIVTAAREAGAAFAVNGDFYTVQGVNAVRNGHILNVCPSGYDLCVLYEDGSMRTIPRENLQDQASAEAVLQNAWQAWSFGPILLQSDGSPIADFSDRADEYLTRVHPRTAIGYYGPGHYCVISVFGYRDDLPGVTLEELSDYFSFLGCKQAYNLDGGGSTHLWFHGSEQGRPSEARQLSDYLYIEDLSGERAA